MRKFVKYLPYRVLVCCFVFLFIGCNNDELNEDKIEVTDVEEIAEIKSIKFIPSFELPETFKEQIVNSFDREAVVLPIVQDVKALDLNVLQKQVLSTYFESHASVIESSGGLTTYALPIKKYSAYGVALKEGSFIKQANSKACPDKDPFEALVINFNGNSSFGDTGMTHVSISPGVSLGQFYVTFNHSNGTSYTILTTSDGTQISTSGTGNGNLGSVISSIWRGIKSFFNGLINLFNAKKCKCKANGISLVIEKQVELSSIEFGNCCDNTSDGGYAMLSALEDVEFEYYFPLPDSLFEKQAAATKKLGINSDDSLDCCALDEVDISTADASIKQDYFKCSCTGDNPLGVASYLELSPDLSFWLAKPKNKSTRDAICTFVIENHFSTQAIAFAKAAVVALENGGEVDFEDRIINELKGKAKCVYDRLETLSGGFKNMIQKFDGDFPVSHLKFEINNNLPSGNYGVTKPPEDYVTTIQMSNTQLANISDLGSAVAFAHEVIHAEIFRKMLSSAQIGNLDPDNMTRQQQINYVNSLRNNFPGIYDYYVERYRPTWNHNLMAQHYTSTIADIVEEFDNNSLSKQVYEDIAWAGLRIINNPVTNGTQTTIAWDNLSSEEKSRIKSNLSNYFHDGTKNCN